MEPVNRKIMLIAVILAAFATFLVYVYIRNAAAKPEVVEYIDVYVAAKTMPAKYKITDADLKQIKITRELLNSKALLNKADIVGKRTKDSIIEGEQILRDRLLDGNKLSLAFNIPQGKRAISIIVNEQTDISHMLRPGDFVDVIAGFDEEQKEESDSRTVFPRITATIIQNVQVLALGQDQAVTDEKVKEPPKTVTLAVTPQEAESLAYASEYAVLRLALRPAGDNESANTTGVTRDDLVPRKGIRVLPK